MTNLIFKTVLSMSVSGSLLILILLGEKRLFKNTCSRQWQYYIWLLVVLRLLFPFGPKAGLMGSVSQAVDQPAGLHIFSAVREDRIQDAADFTAFSGSPAQESEKDDENEEKGQNKNVLAGKQAPERQERRDTGREGLENGMSVFLNTIGLLWLAVALGMFVRKITAYQSFVRYVAAGAKPVSDIVFLDALSVMTKRMGIGRPVELCVNPLLSSPTLTGIFHPCIVLPDANIFQKDFHYIAAHELTHCKRWDILYKWLVQTVVCLHWFNPLVYVMSREIANTCEFSCDEAVLAKMGYENAGDYGKTLLDAMAAVGKCRESSTVVTLSANKELLKERLGAIMACGKKSGKVRVLTVVLTAGMVLGMVCIGICPTGPKVTEASGPAERTENVQDISLLGLGKEETSTPPEKREGDRESGTVADRAGQFYEAENLPLFQLAFGRMDEETQKEWLDKFYRDDEVAFFSAALEQLKDDSPLIQRFAGKAYEDQSYAFFSVLADHMEKETLEEWLDRAIADQTIGFQSLLFDRLGLEDEKDAWEEELGRKQLEEYRAAGVTKEGKNYYYQGQLVNIFLDMRTDSSFYTLDMNPAGVVNVKIIRGEDGKVTGAAYLTEEEFVELFGGEGEENTEAYPRTMYVNSHVCKIRAGAGEEYEVVGLAAEKAEVTVLEMVEGSGNQSWYRLDKESLRESVAADLDEAAEECYIRSDLLGEE